MENCKDVVSGEGVSERAGFVYLGLVTIIKGVVCDSGESLLIFELSSQTNTPLPSELLQTLVGNSQHLFVLCMRMSCDILYQSVQWKRS